MSKGSAQDASASSPHSTPLGTFVNRYGGVGGCVLLAYTLLLACAEACRISAGMGALWWCLSACVVVLVAFPLIVRGLKAIRIPIAPLRNQLGTGQRIAIFAAFFAVPCAILSVWHLAWNPMSLSVDVLEQYEQAMSGQYNDWHPVIHTLLAYKLPLAIMGNPSSIITFQIIGFSAMMAWLSLLLLEYGGIGWAVAFQLFTLLSPNTGAIMTYPWKDVWFATACGFLFGCCLKTFVTRGKWLGSWTHVVAAVVSLVAVILIRHNGILFAAPLLACFVLLIPRRQSAVLCAGLAGLYLVVRLVAYPVLNVASPNQRSVEVLGLPLTVIGEVVKESPDRLDHNTRELVYAIAPQEVWDDLKLGNFNSIKWAPGMDLDAIEEAGAGRVLSTMFRCVVANPKAALKSLLALTRIVWSPDGAAGIRPGISGDVARYPELVVQPSGLQQRLRTSIDAYLSYAWSGLLHYLSSPGLLIWIVVALLCTKLTHLSKRSWAKVLLCLAPILYCFGTMVLLTGCDPRFFFAAFVPLYLGAFGIFWEQANSETSHTA